MTTKTRIKTDSLTTRLKTARASDSWMVAIFHRSEGSDYVWRQTHNWTQEQSVEALKDLAKELNEDLIPKRKRKKKLPDVSPETTCTTATCA